MTWFGSCAYRATTTEAGDAVAVLDVRDCRRPRLVGSFLFDSPSDPVKHDLPDGRTAYVGWYAATVGHPAAVVGAFTPTQAANPVSGLRVVDVSQVQAHRAAPALTVLSEMTGGRQHTETVTRIKGRTYVIGAEEATCPGGNARIVDVTDPRRQVWFGSAVRGFNVAELAPALRPKVRGGSRGWSVSSGATVAAPRPVDLATLLSWRGTKWACTLR